MIEAEDNSSTSSNKQSSGKLIPLILLVLAVAGIAGGIWSYKMYLEVKDEVVELSSIEGQQEVAEKEIDEILVKIGKHMRLPTDEEPVMATVTNAADLIAEQPFYQGAQDGDKVIIFQKAQKAILYNPVEDILINVGPVYLDQNQPPTGEALVGEDGQPLESSPVATPDETIVPEDQAEDPAPTETME